MKKLIWASSALAVVVPLVALAGGSAAQASPPMYSQCYAQGSGEPNLCLQDSGGNSTPGNPIDIEDMANGGSADQSIVPMDVNACNGGWTVTATCPFLQKHWDQQFLGDIIVNLEMANVGDGEDCVAANKAYDIVLSDTCPGPPLNDPEGGEGEWVAVQTSRGCTGYVGYSLVNVWMQNYMDSPDESYVLSGSPVGQQATMQEFNNGVRESWCDTAGGDLP
jgi:hypothetical protein